MYTTNKLRRVHLLLLLSCSSLVAQDEFDFSEVEETQRPNLPLTGRFSLENAWQLSDPSRWVRLGPSLNLSYDDSTRYGQVYFEGLGRYNLAYQTEDDSVSVRDDYETEFLFRELFWKRAVNNVTFSVGRIIDVRGVMDLLQIADKLPAINRVEYFFADPEEVKLGQSMLKAEYFGDGLDVGMLFVPWPTYDRIADAGHPYASVKNQTLHNKDNDRECEGSVYLNRYLYKGAVTLFAGRFNNRSPILDVQVPSFGPSLYYKDYHPYWCLGGASNLAYEPFLIKFETVFNVNKPLQSIVNGKPDGFLKKDELEMALGFDYNHGDGRLYTVEISATWPMQKDDRLAQNRTVWYGAVSASNEYLNDRLKLNFVSFFPESVKNMVNRFQVEYYLTNTLSVSAKYTRFAINQKEQDYGFMTDYDRIDFAFHYDF